MPPFCIFNIPYRGYSQMKSVTAYSDSAVRAKHKFFVADGADFDPQTMAMLQAFYSRSTKSIADRVEGMNPEQVRASLEKYYIGYGHRSIGQCGNFTVFLEDVSMFAAKAIQHHPLYNGQETSTRYYDFSNREMIQPFLVPAFEESIRQLYVAVLNSCIDKMMTTAHLNGTVTSKTELSIRARAFDIARAFLTAGFTTKLSWSTTFDQAQDHLPWLINSPVPELRNIGVAVAAMLREKYPQAIEDLSAKVTERSLVFGSKHFFDDTEKMTRLAWRCVPSQEGPTAFHSSFDQMLPPQVDGDDVLEFMAMRERGEALPRSFAKYGTFTFAFNIDYGSFRDLHRHRNGVVYFPHYRSNYKMHDWYTQQLEKLGVMDSNGIHGMSIRESIKWLYETLLPRAAKIVGDRYLPGSDAYNAAMMYYVPMGTLTTAVMRYDLPQAVYVAELRSGKTVHPTARLAAQHMARAIHEYCNFRLALHPDMSEDVGPVLRRAEQTIFEDQKAIS